MIKNCKSGCGQDHAPQFGKRCKFVIASTMAAKNVKPLMGEDAMKAAGFTGRDDPNYLEYMESEMLKFIEKEGTETSIMDTLVSRLDKFEQSQNARLEKLEQSSILVGQNVGGYVGTQSLPPIVTQSMYLPPPGFGLPNYTVGSIPSSTSTVPTPANWAGLSQQGGIGSVPVSTQHTVAGLSQQVGVGQRPLFGAALSMPASLSGAGLLGQQPAGQSFPVGQLPPRPNSDFSEPLSAALQQLSIAIDPTSASSTKGLLLRPEYYIQHKDQGVPVKSLDHTKLSYKQLVCGMGRVLKYLIQSGYEFMSYLEHYNFVTLHASRHNFLDMAFVGYDRYIVDRVLGGETAGFCAGDSLAVSTFFHAGTCCSHAPLLVVVVGEARDSEVGAAAGKRPRTRIQNTCQIGFWKTCAIITTIGLVTG